MNTDLSSIFLPRDRDAVLETSLAFVSGADHALWQRGLLASAALGTGLRCAELRLLRWEDFDSYALSVKCIRLKKKTPAHVKGVPHSGFMRDTCYVLPDCLSIITHAGKKFSLSQGLLFTDQGELWTKRQAEYAWKMLLRVAGVPFRGIHQCRHTYASMLAADGWTLPEIGRGLGHSRSSWSKVTITYLECNPQLFRRKIRHVPEAWRDDDTGDSGEEQQAAASAANIIAMEEMTQ